MRVIIYYCIEEGCKCLAKNGFVAYFGEDDAEAKLALTDVPSGYVARDESTQD